ncbi:hypothetical protein LJC59_01575, partial [Desulfovibrio sp. OttesenSCG-928-A18]|nr:hypothetical protein [Desulfovibrio sp. OttesenSCG-928-A18]
MHRFFSAWNRVARSLRRMALLGCLVCAALPEAAAAQPFFFPQPERAAMLAAAGDIDGPLAPVVPPTVVPQLPEVKMTPVQAPEDMGGEADPGR